MQRAGFRTRVAAWLLALALALTGPLAGALATACRSREPAPRYQVLSKQGDPVELARQVARLLDRPDSAGA